MLELQFSRLQQLIGSQAQAILWRANVAVFGLGGVGGYATEALARCGLGALTIVDNDVFTLSNLNRQLHALHSTIGRAKVDVVAERIADISPKCKITKYNIFFNIDNADSIDIQQYDYIIDAIDTVPSKLELIKKAKFAQTPIISCMGAGNRLQATEFCVTDIYSTQGCPLAKKMRKLCIQNNINSLKVVYSKEIPVKNKERNIDNTLGSAVFATGVAGLAVAGEVIKSLIK